MPAGIVSSVNKKRTQMNSKQRCLAAISGEQVDRVPVFPLLMFFAQKQLGVSYREFATNGHVLAEAQIHMRDTFGVDAITACSDAFRVTADLGADMVFPEDHPPLAASPLVTSKDDLGRLVRPDPSDPKTRMNDRIRAIQEMVRAVGDDCLVLGWVDMPFAEACSVCGVSALMLMLYDAPLLVHQILEYLTNIVIDFCLAQLEVGAPMIGAGDAASSLLSPRLYREFALPYEQRVCAAVHEAGGMVKLHICGNTTHILGDMVRSEADLFNVDHLVDFLTARRIYAGAQVCFKGNLDPVADLLQAAPEVCQARALNCIQMAAGTRYMLSAGCEVPGDTSDEVFRAFCEAPQRLATELTSDNGPNPAPSH
jgi:MtaA/CmuA family methyltransferase